MNNNCPCPTDVVPSNPCCPDTTTLGSYVDVRDKDCNPRRIAPGSKGVLAAKSGKAGMMDGSADKPISLDVESHFAVDGYILIQAPGGRVLAVKPDTDLSQNNAVLQFVYEGGEFKLVPISFDNLFPENEVPASTSGKMAMIGCSGKTGFIKLGKFLPFSSPQPEGGPWPLVIDSDNDVAVSEIGIDECPQVDSVEQLDALSGCVDGKWKTIVPVKDKTLVGVETAGKVSWELKDSTGGVVGIPRTAIFSKEIGTPYIENSTETINIAPLSGYLTEFKFALLHFQYRVAVSSYNQVVNLAIDGRVYSGIATTGGGFKAESNNNSAIVPIPTTKTWSLSITNAAEQSGSGTGDHHILVSIDGWMK